MPMTGNEMKDLRKYAGLTQAELADHAGLSRKSINEAEGLGDAFVERRTEASVRALTRVAKVRARLTAQAALHRAEGDRDGDRLYGYAAALLTGTFATDEQTIYNLAISASRLKQEVDRLSQARTNVGS
jgi:transcriptional regulator with XRE-family HTH domain